MPPLKVAFLWHQHQPLYRNPRTGRYSMPWVRLHGIKDYYDMAALAGEFPRLHLTINLVPSLLDQLEEYAAGRADDPALALARRPAADLDEEERLALMDLFFSVPYRTLIAPYRRYAALYHKRGRRGIDGDYRAALDHFNVQDLRDLQVWFHLAWCGPTLRRRPEFTALVRKGEDFTEQEKLALLDAQTSFLGEIVPVHGRLQAEGIAELSASPYYHPILPLLVDQSSAREAIPDLPLPDPPFRHPADAVWQVREALAALERRFGSRPRGMWPSEGGLSEAAVRILSEAGVAWAASDEDVLRASSPRPLDAGMIHRPWRLESAPSGTALFFRDHALSDLIGFTYSTWPAEAAAADFISRLRQIGQAAPGGVVSVILDGENAWEHYPDNGVGFLRALYGGLTSAQDLQTVTFSQALESGPEPARLSRLRAGSWIGAGFTTWIGHPEKNRAWSLLASARMESARRAGELLPQHPAWKALAAAEGSDWFWWFGDDHSSEQDALFDASFRDLLRVVYQSFDLPAPPELDAPIKQGRRAPLWSAPTGPIRPELDGRVSDYFEWLTAGVCDGAAGQAAMHQAAGPIRRIAFGSDGRRLFVRVDPDSGSVETMLSRVAQPRIVLEIAAPDRRRIEWEGSPPGLALAAPAPGVRHAAGRVLEIEVDLEGAGQVDLSVGLTSSGELLQRLPRDGTVTIRPGEPPDWSV